MKYEHNSLTFHALAIALYQEQDDLINLYLPVTEYQDEPCSEFDDAADCSFGVSDRFKVIETNVAGILSCRSLPNLCFVQETDAENNHMYYLAVCRTGAYHAVPGEFLQISAEKCNGNFKPLSKMRSPREAYFDLVILHQSRELPQVLEHAALYVDGDRPFIEEDKHIAVFDSLADFGSRLYSAITYWPRSMATITKRLGDISNEEFCRIASDVKALADAGLVAYDTFGNVRFISGLELLIENAPEEDSDFVDEDASDNKTPAWWLESLEHYLEDLDLNGVRDFADRVGAPYERSERMSAVRRHILTFVQSCNSNEQAVRETLVGLGIILHSNGAFYEVTALSGELSELSDGELDGCMEYVCARNGNDLSAWDRVNRIVNKVKRGGPYFELLVAFLEYLESEDPDLEAPAKPEPVYDDAGADCPKKRLNKALYDGTRLMLRRVAQAVGVSLATCNSTQHAVDRIIHNAVEDGWHLALLADTCVADRDYDIERLYVGRKKAVGPLAEKIGNLPEKKIEALSSVLSTLVPDEELRSEEAIADGAISFGMLTRLRGQMVETLFEQQGILITFTRQETQGA